MTPAELYALDPVRIDNDVSHFFDKDLIDLGLSGWREPHLDDSLTTRTTVRYVANDYDGGNERSWQLASVWFDAKPVMVIEYGGHDEYHKERFITDKRLYDDMVVYLRSLLPTEELPPEERIYDLDEDIEGLGNFDGNVLSDYYRTDLPAPLYKVDDVVMGLVRRNHNSYTDTAKIWVRCKIYRVDAWSPENTYHAVQIDRATDFGDGPDMKWRIVTRANNGTIHARLSRDEVNRLATDKDIPKESN